MLAVSSHATSLPVPSNASLATLSYWVLAVMVTLTSFLPTPWVVTALQPWLASVRVLGSLTHPTYRFTQLVSRFTATSSLS
ncbi:hypothetical protein EVA_08464 [gut metagenome]|uniref:Uncharacterized protein n=1 Tax=gut metagenome TaxID=749906 RepID=J9G994_9ZZZZ